MADGRTGMAVREARVDPLTHERYLCSRGPGGLQRVDAEQIAFLGVVVRVQPPALVPARRDFNEIAAQGGEAR